MSLNKIILPKIDFKQYLEDMSYIEAQSLRSSTDFTDDVAEMARMGDQLIGCTMPWPKTHDWTRIGDGKLSIWAGVNGSGKSQLLGQVLTHTMENGRKAVVASLEMQPKQTLYRMICQSATCKASAGYSMAWLEHFAGRLFIYDQLDRVDVDRILAMCHYAAHELDAKDIVIDSLTKCGVGRDDYTKQAEFVDRLQWCAKKWNVHIHLVCHMRKPSQEGGKASKFDIRGAAEITDLADNVYVITRNHRKEEEIAKRDMGFDYNEELVNMPCCSLSIEKNRDYGHQRKFGLFFDRASGAYIETESARVRPLNLEVAK